MLNMVIHLDPKAEPGTITFIRDGKQVGRIVNIGESPKDEMAYTFWDCEKDEMAHVTGTPRAIKLLEARMAYLDKQTSLLREIRSSINTLNP